MIHDFFERCKLLTECKILSFLYDIVEIYQVFLMLSFTFVYCVLCMSSRIQTETTDRKRKNENEANLLSLYFVLRLV